MEIEKKYSVKNLPSDYKTWNKKEIEQGYLCADPVVRIRKSNEEYYLTYKSPTNLSEDTIVSHEVEVPLTKESYYHLSKKIDDHVITKTRYLKELEDGHIAELDHFHGILEGLIFVEVEFESLEAVETFKKPDWFYEDISSDHRFKNNKLIKINNLSELNL